MVLGNSLVGAGRQSSARFLRRMVLTASALVLTGVTLSGCNSMSASSAGVVRAVGAENEYANVISQIGGKYVDVSAIMSNPNTDPHSFEVSTSVAQSVASAQLIVQNGAGYDSFMEQLESATPSKSRDVLSVQSLLGLSNDPKNPHLWYKPTVMPLVARDVERDLIRLQPRRAKYFQRRLQTFDASMTSLDADISSFRAKFSGVKVATTEPVADYLLAALGLDNATPFRFQADVMNGIDPSPEDIAYQQGLFSHHRVKVFCYNSQVSSPVTSALLSLAEKSGVPVVALYETMPVPGYDYQSWMSAEISALTKAIEHKTSTVRI
jgi:zinc/manganese transport system substrate-binding protein